MHSSTYSGSLLLIKTVFASLGGGIEVAAIPEGDPFLISSTLEGPPVGIHSSRGTPASLGASSIPGLDLQRSARTKCSSLMSSTNSERGTTEMM